MDASENMRHLGVLLAVLVTSGCALNSQSEAKKSMLAQGQCELHQVPLQRKEMFSVELSTNLLRPHAMLEWYDEAKKYPHHIPEYFFEKPQPPFVYAYSVEFCPRCESELADAFARRTRRTQATRP